MSKRISEEIKQKIINKIKSDGLSVPKASAEFGISRNTLYNWIGAKIKGDPSILEVARLRRENSELKQIIGGLTLNMERGKKNKER
jgi:transposase-like protein